MKILALVYLIIFSSFSFADWRTDPCILMNEKKPVCTHKIEGYEITVAPSGNINLNDSIINIPIPKLFEIESAKDVQLINGVIYLSLEITDYDSGSTVLISISTNNKSIIWQTEFPVFNTSPMLIEHGYIYIGGIGKVAKFDARTGKKVWQHENLYEHETQSYNSFKVPYIDLDTVIFPEFKVSNAKYVKPRKVKVNKHTGLLISK
jgi:outer membrane protein assembly factor BamB